MDVDAYRAHLGLKPLPHTTPPADPKPEVRLTAHVDRSRTDSRELRGIPAVGYGVAGVMPGTRPGDTPQAETPSTPTQRIRYASTPSTEARHDKPPTIDTW